MQGDLVLRNVSKSYGAIRALDEVNLTIRRGEFLTVLGPSGSGKSTLLMVLAGFIDPETGSMRLGERELLDLRPHQRNIGVVFQNYALFPHMNVHQNVAFPLRMRGMDRQEIEHRVSRALQLVHLESLKGREIDQLSGGQRQRVALARAIVFEPPLLLMDEPLSALDKKLREQMQLEIRRLHGQLGTTTIYVTHDQREAITLSDRVAVLDRGRLVQVDSPRDLYERPHDRFIADFVGESSFLPIEFNGNDIELNGRRMLADNVARREACQHYLLLRPERLMVLGEQISDPTVNQFAGQVLEQVYQGDSVLLYIRLDDGGEISLRAATRNESLTSLPSAGSRVSLGLHRRDTVVVPEADA